MAILPAGVDIQRISDPTGAGVGVIFHPRVRPTPAPWIGGCRRGFHFSLVGDPWISEILNFDGFDLVSPPKYPSISKFWPSPIISATQVPYRNPMWRLSYSPTLFFSWFSNLSWSCDRIHIHLAQTRGWLETHPKPGGCDFSPVGVATSGFGRVPRVWPWAGFCQTRPEPSPLPSLLLCPPDSSSIHRRHTEVRRGKCIRLVLFNNVIICARSC
jgi:hypothetical protein